MHKGFKCLDVSEGRIYIFRDVIFDETIFPFTKLHSNAGTHFRSEVLLLPDSGDANTETNLLDDLSCTSNHTGENAEENIVLMQQDVPTSQSLTGADSDDDSGDAVPDSMQGSALGSPSVLPHVHAPTTGQ
jgi:hypothetical protein